MDRAEVYRELREFVARELLHGKDEGLDEKTPLLEWGIIDSLAMINLLTFIENRWKIRIPEGKLNPDHFRTLQTVTDLLLGGNT